MSGLRCEFHFDSLYADVILVFDGIKGKWDVGNIGLVSIRLEVPKNRFQSEMFEMILAEEGSGKHGLAAAQMMYRGTGLRLHQRKLGGVLGFLGTRQPKGDENKTKELANAEVERGGVVVKSMSSPADRRNIFIGYCHGDSRCLRELRVHLKPLEFYAEVIWWDDTRLEAGG